MALIERIDDCTSCIWTGRVLVENTKQQEPFQELGSLIAVGLRKGNCPECGGDTIPSTKQMVS